MPVLEVLTYIGIVLRLKNLLEFLSLSVICKFLCTCISAFELPRYKGQVVAGLDYAAPVALHRRLDVTSLAGCGRGCYTVWLYMQYPLWSFAFICTGKKSVVSLL